MTNKADLNSTEITNKAYYYLITKVFYPVYCAALKKIGKAPLSLKALIIIAEKIVQDEHENSKE